MAGFVLPQVYLVGATEMDVDGVKAFLRGTGQEEFLEEVYVASSQGVPGGMILCSIYAKLCYRALVKEKNVNLLSTRSIQDNILGTFAAGHGSVFEHCSLNFVVTGCSRVYTHEQVRHRVGTAYSQVSGRYCRLDSLNLVLDPVLSPAAHLIKEHLERTEDLVYLLECELGLREPPTGWPNIRPENVVVTRDERTRWVPSHQLPFSERKKITSAIRRVVPNGQENEMGMTLNLRTLRHTVELRTAPGAEWEIRFIYAKVYELLLKRWPLLFHDAKVEVVDGLPWVHGMKQQPY